MAIGHRLAVFVGDAHLVIRAHGAALGGEDALGFVVQAGVVDQALGHAEYLLQLATQLRRHPSGLGLGEAGTAHLHHPQAGQAGALLGCGSGLQPERHRRRHQGHPVHLMALDQFEAAQRLGITRHDHAAASDEHAQGARRAEGVVVPRRQGAEKARRGGQLADFDAASEAVVVVVVGTRDQLGRTGAATGELEEGHLATRGGRQLIAGQRGVQALLQAARVVRAIQQHLAKARCHVTQLTEEAVVAEQVVLAGSDHQPGLDLLRIGQQFQLLVTEQGVDRRDAGLEQGEEHHIELGHVGQLHQRRVVAAQTGGLQVGGQAAGALVQLGVAQLPLAAEDRRCLG